MRERWLYRFGLVVPAFLGVIACTRGLLVAKVGVPLTCGAILLAAAGRGGLRRMDLWALVAALGCSAVGDAFLSLRAGRESYFLAGIAWFFGAHLGYLAFARAHGPGSLRGLLLLLGVFVPYYLIALWPRLPNGALPFAVLLYLLVSCVALAAAIGMTTPWRHRGPFIAGIALIVLSDTFISFHEFLQYRAWNAWILPTYYLAHLCVTWAALSGPRTSEWPRSTAGARPPRT